MIQGHGDDIYQYKNIEINFSSNVDTHQDLSALRKHLIEQIGSIHSYPEPNADSLIQLLAEKNEVSESNICVTNGATEAIYLIAQAFRNANTAILVPTFSEYEDACTLNGHHLSFLNNLSESKGFDMVWLCNPNNPTGFAHSKADLEKTITSHKNTLFIIDQSYEHFSLEKVFSIKEALHYPNLIVLHSMTKHFAIPGLRLGYLSGNANWIKRINKYRMPWSVNQLAIEAGKFLETEYNNKVNLNLHLKLTQELQEELSKIEELKIYPTSTHFFLCKIRDKQFTALDLKNYLAEHFGILIRDCSNFRGLTPQHFRIASQTKGQNKQLVEAIKQWTIHY